MAPIATIREIRLARDRACTDCERRLARGTSVFQMLPAGTVRCPACVAGVAGRGARQRYEHLRAEREARIRARHGGLGVALARLGGDPQHIRAWKTGAEGEERVAARLGRLLRGRGVLLLHDRRLPRSRANVDHLAVGPGGVTVIDAKNLRGRVTVGRTGGALRPAAHQLRIAGRDRTKLVDGVERQVAAVRAVLEAAGCEDVTVTGALCLLDAEGLPLLGSLRVRDVGILGPRGTARLAARRGPIAPTDVTEIHAALARRLPAA